MKDDPRYLAAIAAFDRDNAQDPTCEMQGDVARPRELVQAERFTEWLTRLNPKAPEDVWLAVRCQHIRRWERPRGAYAQGRAGYLLWRRDLATFHADTAAQILSQVGYEAQTVDRVRSLNLKQGLKKDADAQTVEDVLCLSFIAHEYEEFSRKHPQEKVIDILRKTWQKMSSEARNLALTIELAQDAKALLAQALQPRAK